MSSIERYFGEKVSLLSTSDVRYDGELYTADPSEQSIALKHVNCAGTEGRRTGDQVIAPSDCTYEFIIFRAVNIRELWLQKSGGQKISLNKEVLEPLRSGTSGGAKESFDDAPKRKVGYQARNQGGGRSGGGRGGYDYYGGSPPDPYNGGRYGRSGYGPPPGPYGDHDYPPARGYGRPPRGYAPPYGGYYDAPHGNGYYQRGYRQGRYQGSRQSYYAQGQRQREPQYYNNQQRGYSAYYGQGYQDRQYNGRYPQQYDYSNYNSRGYSNRGYNGRRDNRGDRGTGQAGTGAFLDSRRLRGDEIDVKDQQEFDFDAAKKDFDQNKDDGGVDVLVNAVDSMTLEAAQVANGSSPANANGGGDNGGDDNGGKKVEEDTKEDGGDNSNKYDRNKSFFDGLSTETKKSKPRQNLQTQKDIDTSTFGSVAATYKSRHINRSNNRRQQGGYQQRNNGYGYGGGRRGDRRYDDRGPRSYEQYNRQQGQQRRYQQPQGGGGGGYRNNRWVEKR